MEERVGDFLRVAEDSEREREKGLSRAGMRIIERIVESVISQIWLSRIHAISLQMVLVGQEPAVITAESRGSLYSQLGQ